LRNQETTSRNILSYHPKT